MSFSRRYGPWALVAGSSEGLGAAFAEQLASRGLNLLLVARRAPPLVAQAKELAARYGVETLALSVDLAADERVQRIEALRAGREVGLLIYNAALSPIGHFLEGDVEQHRRALRVNCEGPLTLTHHYGQMMARRGRGGVVLMSSLSGIAGSPLISSYAATKAFNNILAAGLWEELRSSGIDVLACCAGATRTPNYLASLPANAPKMPEQEPEEVAREALDALGRGPICVPGRVNQLGAWAMQRLLPRRLAVALMARSTRALYGERS